MIKQYNNYTTWFTLIQNIFFCIVIVKMRKHKCNYDMSLLIKLYNTFEIITSNMSNTNPLLRASTCLLIHVSTCTSNLFLLTFDKSAVEQNKYRISKTIYKSRINIVKSVVCRSAILLLV